MADFTKLNGYYVKDSAARQDIDNIEAKIPSQATQSNQLADKNFVNSSIENVAAYYITKDAAGNPFSTKAELNAATTFYSGGVARTPTRNDYCVVLKDESKTVQETGENPTTRYLYDNNTWSYQYIVNNSGLTAAQWAAVNSGIIAEMIPSGASGSDKLAKSSDVEAKYTKPTGGIPKTDLASDVQTSLGKADAAAKQSDFEQFQQSVKSEFDKTDLLKEEIFGTTQEINFNSAGQVSSIVHKKSGSAYRTDTFTYGTDTITEARTITAIGTLTIVTNLSTLVTTVTFTAA